MTNHYASSINFAGYAKATESLYTINLKTHSPGFDGQGQGAWVSLHQWSGGTNPADAKPKDFHNTEQQEEFQWGPSIHNVVDTSLLKPDHWFFSLDTW